MGELTRGQNCIFERVYVETPVDTDHDGKYDLVAVYIRRPESTLGGEKVPAVYVANPYLMTCNEDWYIPHNVDQNIKVYPEQNITEKDITYDFHQHKEVKITEKRITQGYAETSVLEGPEPEFECISELYAHLNERGYASVFCGGLGTRGSEGFTITGSEEELQAFKSVIDWLNGRCRAFTNRTDNIEIKAEWCTGKVAMSAKSYLGTMCIGVAATGVEGLETIIPEAGIVNWYEYYRYNGLNLPAIGWQGDDLDILAKYCFSRAKDDDYPTVKEDYDQVLEELVEQEDRNSGNYNLFWDERNYLKRMDQIKASVLIIHGLNDWNVKTNQCAALFEELQKRGIERRMVLHQGEHVYIYRLENAGVTELIDRWLDHYLKGIDNGVEKESSVQVESNIDQSCWSISEEWPVNTAQMVRFPITGKETGMFIDDIRKTVFDKQKDNLKEWRDELVLSEDSSYMNRLKYVWDLDSLFQEDTIRLSGTVQVKFKAAIDQKTAVLSAMIVDLGEACRLTNEQITKGESFVFGVEEQPSAYKVITRGWLNAQNRTCIWSKEEIRPGEYYDYSFKMIPTDYQIPKGHKLAFIIYGIDAEATQRQEIVTTVKVQEATIEVDVPLSI